MDNWKKYILKQAEGYNIAIADTSNFTLKEVIKIMKQHI